MATQTNDRLDDLNANIAQKVRALRRDRGWSLAVLADHAGLSKTAVAKLESGTGNPSIETLLGLAGALDITIGALLATERTEGTRVVRVDGAEFVRSSSGLKARGIWSDGRNRRVETQETLLEPGVDYHSAAHAPGTEELIVCVSGWLVVGPEGHEVELHARDAAHFAADVPHRYHSVEGATAVCLMSYPAKG